VYEPRCTSKPTSIVDKDNKKAEGKAMATDIMIILQAYGDIIRRYLTDEEMKQVYGPVFKEYLKSKEENFYGEGKY